MFEEALTQNYQPLQEEVLALVSCIATLIEEKFVKYYPNFMPGLKKIILETPNETTHQRDLRSNTIQTIGFLLDAIKGDKENIAGFREDAREIVGIFSKLLNSGSLTDDDPQVTAITNALTQAAAVLKEDFAPYMPEIMDRLLAGTKVEVDFKLEDAELPHAGDDENLTTVTFKMKGLDGQKKLSLNTNALETKINSAQVVRALVENLGTTFLPYVEPTFEALSTLFDYKYSRAVRGVAIECCQYLLLACTELAQQEALMGQLYPKFEACVAGLIKKKDTQELVGFLKEFYHCIKVFKKPSPLSPSQLIAFIGLMKEACQLAWEDKQITLDEMVKKRDVLDEEDNEQYLNGLDEIEKVYLYVMEISGQLMRIYREDVTDLMRDQLFQLFVDNINKSENTQHEVIDSLCFFIDCCEFLSHDYLLSVYKEMFEKFSDIYEQYKDDEDRDIVQSLSFGLGVIAARITNEQFSYYADRVYSILEEVINVPERMSEENSYATENALSSLLKLVYFQKDTAKISDEKVREYLELLPARDDLDEALALNKLLIEQVENKNANLFGKGGCNAKAIEQALNRIAEHHHEDPELGILDEEYSSRLSNLLSQ